jgi:hypothetical protein
MDAAEGRSQVAYLLYLYLLYAHAERLRGAFSWLFDIDIAIRGYRVLSKGVRTLESARLSSSGCLL